MLSRNQGAFDMIEAGTGSMAIPAIGPQKLLEVWTMAEVLRQSPSGTIDILKLDIEGAEWKILHDKNSLISLKNHKAKMLVALHPGFHRPYRKHWMFLNRIAIEIWRLNNFIESIKIFNKLINYCSISRTNLNPVKKPLTFALLVLAGYHEFILDFSSVQ